MTYPLVQELPAEERLLGSGYVNRLRLDDRRRHDLAEPLAQPRERPFDMLTPIADVRLPRTVLHWRFGKPGYETAERAGDSFDGTYRVQLAEGDVDAAERILVALFLPLGVEPEADPLALADQ